MQIPARLSGAAAARYILDQAGCQNVGIEEVPGTLSDHYDPRDRVLRLSGDIYNGRSATAVGIAAHESGHALQHATNYAPLLIRNAAVPAATFGGTAFSLLLFGGMILAAMGMAIGVHIMLLGVVLYGAVLVFQIVNLPVEFDASARAKHILREYQIFDGEGAIAVDHVLNAASIDLRGRHARDTPRHPVLPLPHSRGIAPRLTRGPSSRKPTPRSSRMCFVGSVLLQRHDGWIRLRFAWSR